MKVFVSHATVDNKLAEKLVELLRLGTDLAHDDIFLSSAGGSIPTGTFFVEHILKELNVIVSILTRSYFQSEFCLAEAGAALARKTAGTAAFHPLVVSPVVFSDLGGVLYGVQSGRLLDATALAQLRDDIAKGMTKRPSTPVWESKRDVFLEEAGEIIKKSHWDARAAFSREQLGKTKSNPRYPDDILRFDQFYKLDSIISKESVIIVVGSKVVAELLDRPVAAALRDRIDERGEGRPFRRGIVLTDEAWFLEKGIADNPVFAVGGPRTNKLTAEFDKWVPPPGAKAAKYTVPGAPALMGFFRKNNAGLPQVARWGPTGNQTREAVQRYVEDPQGLAEFLKISRWT